MEKEKKRIFIQKIQNLPTLPTTLMKIVSVAEDENSTAKDLGDIISKDQSISSIILRLVNSAFYGHMRQVSSIPHSIVILGFRTVKTMALGVSIFRSSSGGKKQAFDRSMFWIHSIGVATFAKRLGKEISFPNKPDLETIFLSGLLHDIGKVVFDNYFNLDYDNVAKAAINNKEWIGAVEKRELEIDHSEAGYYLAQKWQFPQPVVESIRYHHALDEIEDENKEIASIVHISDYCCRKMSLGSGGDNEQVPLSSLAMDNCKITEEKLDEIIADVEKERESIEAFALS